MATRINPGLIDDLAQFGAEDVQKCYHCGNCTATCPFSKEPFIFPRKWMRHLQMGMEHKLQGSVEPWLCYYCGECSEECPREAQPGETMMALRRWLISRYDFTGLSAMMYKNHNFAMFMMVLVGVLTAVAMFVFGGNVHVFDPVVEHGVVPTPEQAVFIDRHAMHVIDLIAFFILLGLLVINTIRMWNFIILSDKSVKVPFSLYVKHILQLPLHFFTQKRYSECDKKKPFYIHIFLAVGYMTSFILIMLFLREVQHPEFKLGYHFFGYVGTAFLIFACTYGIIGRFQKKEEHYKHSHHTDWAFIVTLLLVTVTGILTHIVHRMGMDFAANIIYVIHMMFVAPMLILDVPFNKWAHLIYRPVAMFFAAIKAEAIETATETAPADTARQLA